MMTPALPLALIPIGTPTGLIVNVGYHDTSVICVYEGLFSLTLFLVSYVSRFTNVEI